MDIIEETTALGVPFCHFRTISNRNQYNLTYTKTATENQYEVHLIPLVIHQVNGKTIYDKDLRRFVCNKLLDFMAKNRCSLYFNINCIGLSNEYLVWKFLRWIRQYKSHVICEVKITEDNSNSIRFFEFYISMR